MPCVGSQVMVPAHDAPQWVASHWLQVSPAHPAAQVVHVLAPVQAWQRGMEALHCTQ